MNLSFLNKMSLVSALSLVGLAAQAQVSAPESFSCKFTEPFMQLRVDLKNGLLSQEGVDFEEWVSELYTIGSKEVFSDEQGNPTALVLTYGRERLLQVDFKTPGSDGMSDNTYAWTGALVWMTGEGRLIGGCDPSTLTLK